MQVQRIQYILNPLTEAAHKGEEEKTPFNTMPVCVITTDKGEMRATVANHLKRLPSHGIAFVSQSSWPKSEWLEGPLTIDPLMPGHPPIELSEGDKVNATIDVLPTTIFMEFYSAFTKLGKLKFSPGDPPRSIKEYESLSKDDWGLFFTDGKVHAY